MWTNEIIYTLSYAQAHLAREVGLSILIPNGETGPKEWWVCSAGEELRDESTEEFSDEPPEDEEEQPDLSEVENGSRSVCRLSGRWGTWVLAVWRMGE